MIMIIAIIYIFCYNFTCDIWSTVENYFQKILRPPPHPPPWKNPLPPKNSKSENPPFLQTFFKPPPPPTHTHTHTHTHSIQIFWKFD